MSKFTEGEWVITRKYDKHGNEHEFVYVDGENSNSKTGNIATCGAVGSSMEEMLANAHLISAAPDMYEALGDVMSLVEFLADHLIGRMDDEDLEDMQMQASDWREVLEKARGES